MKSRLGITHPENLCTIAEIYRPSVIFLLLVVWLCLTFAYTQRAPEEAGSLGEWVRLCVTVIESHSRSLKLVPIAEFCMRITIIVHYCDAVYLLWLPRYNDLSVENLHFCHFYPRSLV